MFTNPPHTPKHNLRKGMTVRLTFQGVLASADHTSVNFVAENSTHPTMPLSWSTRMEPEVQILDPGFRDGDVGVWTSARSGVKLPVVFRVINSGVAEGWYGVLDGELRAAARESTVELVLRADGTRVES